MNVKDLLLVHKPQNCGRKVSGRRRRRRDAASAEAEPSVGGGADHPVGRADRLSPGTCAPQTREKVDGRGIF